MTQDERRALIGRYRAGIQEVEDALRGASDADLDARPAPGKWTAREIVHHLADSEMTSAVRLRMLIAEHAPAIHAYDQAEYARRLKYDRPIANSLQVFRFARETTAEILDRLTADEWQRAGTHPEHGAYTVEGWLRIYANHAHDHAGQIRRARASRL